MISASLPPLPTMPGPSSGSAGQTHAPPEASQDPKARPFARLLNAAGGTKDGRRPTATGKHEGAQEPTRPAPPATQQAEPTGDVPADGPAPESATATDPAATPTDAAALLAALPPLQPRPLPPGGGSDSPLQPPTDGLKAGSGHKPVDANSPVPAPPGPAASAQAGATAFADALREAGTASADSRSAEAAKAAAAELPPLPPALANLPTATTVAASAPAEARIAATPGSADFASQLGAQLSTFVRDGVQHARLELHPVELGPVTVQIQLDGNNAQVNLAAEQAPTRAALEDALPQLAGSLREAGLTLTGGGVFEQPRQSAGSRGDGTPTRETTARTEREAARESVTLQPLAAPRRRGVVDLVA